MRRRWLDILNFGENGVNPGGEKRRHIFQPYYNNEADVWDFEIHPNIRRVPPELLCVFWIILSIQKKKNHPCHSI